MGTDITLINNFMFDSITDSMIFKLGILEVNSNIGQDHCKFQ